MDLGKQASDSTASPAPTAHPLPKTCLLPDGSINAEDEERLFTNLAAAAVDPGITGMVRLTVDGNQKSGFNSTS